MKKRNLFKVMALFVALGMMLGFTSCSKDDDGDGSIEGIWTFNSLSIDAVNPENPEAITSIQGMVVLINTMMQGSTLEAKSDGTIKVTVTALGETTISTGRYEKVGNKYIITMDAEDDVIGEFLPLTEVSATVNNNTLTIFGDSLTDELIAEGFTKCESTMVFKK